MFIAALFTIARCWKQLKCPSLNEWILKLWYTYTVEYYTAEIKNKLTVTRGVGDGDNRGTKGKGQTKKYEYITHGQGQWGELIVRVWQGMG